MPRIGFNAAHFKKRQTGGFDLIQDGSIERRCFQPLAPVDEQNPAAVLREFGAQFLNLIVSKIDMCGDPVFKIRVGHDVFLLFKGLLCYHEEKYAVPFLGRMSDPLSFVHDCTGTLGMASRKAPHTGA